jgi:predicted ATPase
MLRSIHLKDFKSFADEEVKLAPLTMLVGSNASGKSNLLDAIRFIQGLALGFPLAEVLQGRWEAGREIWKGIRGGSAEVIRAHRPSAEILTAWDLESIPWQHRIAFGASNEPEILGELLRNESTGKPAIDFDEQARRALLGTAIELTAPISFAHSLGEARYRSLLREERNRAARTSEAPIAGLQLCTLLEGSIFLTLTPERMRAYVPKRMREIGAEGENISSVLWTLCQDASARQEWVDWLSELCAPEIDNIDFIETELGDVMLVLVEKNGTRTSARSLSDGTLRFLGTLVALRTAPKGSMVLMEEPETGLHPQRIHLLVEYLESVTRARGIQVIATTHSPQLLQSLSPESRSNAVLCARLPDQPGTLLRRLGDLPHFTEVSASTNIDHLFTTGWLERAL